MMYKVHRSRIKCIINPVLRKLQYYTNKPYVIASFITDKGEFSHYVVKRVEYVRSKTSIDLNTDVLELKFEKCIQKTFMYYLNRK